MKPIECARIEEQDITFADISTRPGDSLIDIGSIDIGAWVLVGDIDARSITIEKVEGHLLNRGGFRMRIQVAQGIDMGRAMIAHQEAPGLIGKAALKVLRCLLVRMMFPYDGLQMPWVDIHSLVNLLREVNEPRHRFASIRVHVLAINTSLCQVVYAFFMANVCRHNQRLTPQALHCRFSLSERL